MRDVSQLGLLGKHKDMYHLQVEPWAGKMSQVYASPFVYNRLEKLQEECYIYLNVTSTILMINLKHRSQNM